VLPDHGAVEGGKPFHPTADGSDLVLEPGRIYLVDGAQSFSPKNPHAEPLQMLIHLIKK
jgi:hypothetical protein